MFIGSAKQKVGNLVLYIRKGSQITRAYQSQVKNPKTNRQMVQRAKFANAVKFYQKAVQHFFKFAYQDQRQNETAFNAFMRHNVAVSSQLLKSDVQDAYFPALGRWVLSSGSLPNAMVPKFDGTSVLFANTGLTAANTTVASVSNILIGQGFQVGDVVTFVMISSLITSLDFDLSSYYDSGNLLQPQWDIRQFIISTTDATELNKIPSLGPSLGTLAAAAGGLSFTFNNPDYCNFAGVVVTRKGSSVSYSSNSELVPNSVALAMINAATTDNWLDQVLASWDAQGDAILHGSIADTVAEAVKGVSGTGASGGSSSGGTTTSSAISTVNGSNPPITIYDSGAIDVTVVGTALSTVAPTSNNSSVTISDFTITTDRTQATFKVNIPSDDYVSATISYMGKTVANVEADNSSI